ncbi:endonuclease/exonuclease/phosphatase family protein [Ulvibacterium sp.]|uniref:endonuclease/exonuclease/phosphatase family protein n=1 Tax=Ulvibacterium sp. TaxID=2665914 RepID=UPI0026105C3C|nr:endonuclease/exonuclease/phosphatase family protein [Ulvibacterium sp.]
MKTHKPFPRTKLLFLFSLILLSSCITDDFIGHPGGGDDDIKVRFATYNASLNRSNEGELISDLSTPNNAKAKLVAEVIQRQTPDVVALLEFDYDSNGTALDLFQKNYLGISQNGADAVTYEYAYSVSSNTGVLAEVDLDGNGEVSIPGDTYGFGFFPGQFAFAILSKYKIQKEGIRTFQQFLWKDMPDALVPVNEDSSSYYSEEALEVFRLSSKNHVDMPIQVTESKIVHALIAHPTPPVFDGPEDRNGTRNHDEIRFISDYINDENYIYDDNGFTGGLASGAHFVVMGDMNADTFDGDATNDPIGIFESNPKINQSVLTGNRIPSSEGGTEASIVQGEINDTHIGDPAYDTADFGDTNPGNLRVDYVLPSANLKVVDSGVFWPTEADAQNELNTASDHKLVWIDLEL